MPAAAHQRPPAGTVYLDHVSHFVPDLGAAAQALAVLGFAVTAPSAQRTQDGPAGTSNVCVMLGDGYLEFLAPAADTPNAQRLRAAMQRYPGVHLACFGTPAAAEEHARLERHGFDPLPLVELARPVAVAATMHTARFNVVRLPPGRMPEGRIQYVEHLTPELLWQRETLGHANGVRGLACAFVVAADPIETAARWARFAALLPRPAGDYVHLATARGHVLVGTARHWSALLGDAPAAPALAGYALECRDPRKLAGRCAAAGLALRRLRRDLYAAQLPPALGGAWVFGTRAALALPQDIQ
jgi:hypothetical protein